MMRFAKGLALFAALFALAVPASAQDDARSMAKPWNVWLAWARFEAESNSTSDKTPVTRQSTGSSSEVNGTVIGVDYAFWMGMKADAIASAAFSFGDLEFWEISAQYRFIFGQKGEWFVGVGGALFTPTSGGGDSEAGVLVSAGYRGPSYNVSVRWAKIDPGTLLMIALGMPFG